MMNAMPLHAKVTEHETFRLLNYGIPRLLLAATQKFSIYTEQTKECSRGDTSFF